MTVVAEGLFVRILDRLLGRVIDVRHNRPKLELRYAGGWSSSGQGVEYPFVVRNTGPVKAWDVIVRLLHDGEETQRRLITEVAAEEEAKVLLLIPSSFCELMQGVGNVPRGRVTCEAHLGDKLVGEIEVPKP